MSRRNHGRHGRGHDEDSSSSTWDDSTSSGNGRRTSHRDDDDDIEVSFDFRDIPGQLEAEHEYFRKNKDRRADSDSQALYKEITKGTRVTKWAGRRKGGETLNVGLASLNAEVGIYEGDTTVGELTVGVTNDEDQLGLEAEVTAIEANKRLGPVRINASALGVGYDVGIGRNTGGFVRGNLASVGGSVGPVGATVGVGFDSGGRIGMDGVEAKLLGSGVMIDRNEGIELSAFGSSVKFKFW